MMPKHILLSLFFLLSLATCPRGSAAELPSLGTDPAIKTGTLPCGLKYYLVKNGCSKGYADYALVRHGYDDISGSRGILTRVNGTSDIKPSHMLAGKGIGYGPEGYVHHRDGASIFHLRDVPTFDREAADSTLLMLFEVIRDTDCPQTLIVSGDIDSDKLSDRIYMLSMTIPRIKQAIGLPESIWEPFDRLEYETVPTADSRISEIRLTVEAPRAAAEHMNTSLPLITERFARLLSSVLSERLSMALHKADIPADGIHFLHEDSAVKAGNELYTISIFTHSDDAEKAASIFSETVDNLARWGAGISDFTAAVTRLKGEETLRSIALSNSEYVDRCVCAELYGASLASEQTRRGILNSSRLSPAKELPLFNNYVRALFYPKGVAAQTDSIAVMYGRDSLVLAEPGQKAKLKVKSSAPDPITGGELWTYSNGMKVIFKKADTPGRFEYGLMIKGGAPLAPGMLESFDVAGLKGSSFRNLLIDRGITMDCTVSVSDLRISGVAPSKDITTVMNALSALSAGREFNPDDYYYMYRCQRIARIIRGADPDEELELMRSPEYPYCTRNLADSINTRLPLVAIPYFESQFSRMNDGVMVIIGDFDGPSLQKTLTRYLAPFHCGKATTVRQRVRHDIRRGWYTKTVAGRNCTSTSLTVCKPFSMDGYMTFKLASTVLRREVIKALEREGMYAEFSENVEFFPTEAYTMEITCRPCQMDGLPDFIRRQSQDTALDAVRSAINRLSHTEVPASLLNACKAELKNSLSTILISPSFLAEAAMIRYSTGRDIVSSCSSAVDRVGVADVKALLSELEKGSQMEIIIK